MDFKYPYAPFKKALPFTNGDGSKTQVSYFGIPQEAEEDMLEQRKQVRALYSDDPVRMKEYAIELDATNKEHEIILAVMPRPKTLEDALDRLNKGIERFELNLRKPHSGFRSYLREIDSLDALQIPEIAFDVTHSFDELTKGSDIVNAQQQIIFNLNRKGVQFTAAARGDATGIPRTFAFDRPFLVMLRLRGHKLPYFAMWVDNAGCMK